MQKPQGQDQEHKPWIGLYPPGTRADLDAPPFRTLGELPTAAGNLYGDKPAFTTVMPNGMNGGLSFAQIDLLSSQFAIYLREVLKLDAGDRVAVQTPNCLGFPIIAFGVFKACCVLVNTNPLYTADEMTHQFNDAKPKVLLIIDMFADKLEAVQPLCNIPHIILIGIADFFPMWPRLVISTVLKYVKKQVPFCRVQHSRFTSAVEAGARFDDLQQRVDGYTAQMSGEEIAALQYTGGTTGVAKGAMLSHRNLIMNMAQSIEMVGVGIPRGEAVMLTALPLYHIFAFTINLLGFTWLGAHNILIPSPRPLTNMRRAFENFGITWMSGVNTLYNGLNNSKWFANTPPRTLQGACAGGMALQSSVAQRWFEITGVQVVEGYGLTETSPVVTFNPFGKVVDGSIGIPIPSTLVRCVDDNGSNVPVGEPGELAVRGPQVMLGYWQQADETKKVMKDGWLLTGDIATMDAQGYVRIVDRKKDMILHSGFNIYPNEVEECLMKHPGVLEAAVIGAPDGASGEAVKAFVVKRDMEVTAEQLRDFCKTLLTAYKVPRTIEFRSDLPKSPVGKILRKELRV